MLPPDQVKSYEVETPEGLVSATFAQLEEGDKVRIVRPDGTVEQGPNGASWFVVTQRPVMQGDWV